MKTLLFTLMVLFLTFCGTLKATSADTLITKNHQITNIWVIDNNKDGKPEYLLIEICLNGKFDKVLVYNEIGFYIGYLRIVDGKLIFTDLDGITTPFELLQEPATKPPLKQT